MNDLGLYRICGHLRGADYYNRLRLGLVHEVGVWSAICRGSGLGVALGPCFFDAILVAVSRPELGVQFR
jgi:hypothetical protein